ncbi:hypothetical protein ATM97_29165 [Nocardia sp. MH4]|uniref:Uncharacterized protein n=1 Tax=Nocardia fluminea TaxID=134984 RepID=A0A2N3VD47_9NOCA|nr:MULTISPECIES: hypothetical protein [Nocardia]MBW0275348.1 hypothetical protein [Nocardia sp. MH4]PKV79562.1 hypothetical protein ATK86_3958 [Nocardia fluminea]
MFHRARRYLTRLGVVAARALRRHRSVLVTVYLANDPLALITGYTPGTALTLADRFDLDLTPRLADTALLERVFARDTGGPDDVVLGRIFDALNDHPEPGDEHLTTRWYSGGRRSLSVGDVVALSGRHYACAPIGWEPIAAPD